MIIFISGSVNAGKSTTSKLVAEKINAEWIDVDEIAQSIPNFNLSKDIPKAIDLAIVKINGLTNSDKSVVSNFVLRQKDFEQLHKGLDDKEQYYFTLAPRLEVVRRDRGRGLNEWEHKRIKYHYDTGIANPAFGEILDTSEMNLKEVADKIISMVK